MPVKTNCEVLLRALEDKMAGKGRSNQFGPMTLVTVRDLPGELTSGERAAAEQMEVASYSRDEFWKLPVAFQRLLMKLLPNVHKKSGTTAMLPQFWYTPDHWYDTAPEVFPVGHRERERPDSRTQVFTDLSEVLLQTIAENPDLVEDAELYTLPNKYMRAASRRQKATTAHSKFNLEIADSEGAVFAKWVIEGRSGTVFNEELAQLAPPASGWADWDSFGDTSDKDVLTLQSLAPVLNDESRAEWTKWIEAAIQIQKLKSERLP